MPCLGRDRISAGNRKHASHGAARVLLAAIIAALGLALSTPAKAQTTITVTDTGDPSSSGGCTLRDAINVAQGGSASPGDTCVSSGSGSPYTIVFSVTGTIMLSSSLPAIANSAGSSLTIDGTGQTITIDGGGSYEVMLVNSGATLNVAKLTIADGVGDQWWRHRKRGTLTVTNSTFSGNRDGRRRRHREQRRGDGDQQHVLRQLAATTAAASNGGDTMTVTNSTFSGNLAP